MWFRWMQFFIVFHNTILLCETYEWINFAWFPLLNLWWSLKFKDEIHFTTFDNLMEDDANVVFELLCLASDMINKIVRVLNFLFPFLKKMKKNLVICFLWCWTLVLKTLFILFSLIGHDNNIYWPLLKNMIKYICFFLKKNVIIICIFWLKLKRVLLI